MKVSHSAYITLFKLFLFLFLSLPIMPNEALSSNLIYRENFDDQKVDTPPFGYTDVKGPYWWAPGRGGQGYSFSGEQNIAAYILWWINQTWPTDEMYVSFWFRFANFTTTDSNENIKMFYPHYGVDGLGYTTFTLYTANESIASIKSDSGTLLNPTVGGASQIYMDFSGQTNGNWHHFEFWIKFSTAELKYWYDGKLKAYRDFQNTTDGADTWGGYIKYITLGSIDAEEAGTFMRQFDDWEVWDGIPPFGSTDNKAPSAPQFVEIR